MKCQCRLCLKTYESTKSRGEWTGFCSAKCQHQMAKELGYHKGTHKSEYEVLSTCQEIGDVPVEAERVELREELETLERHNSRLSPSGQDRVRAIKTMLGTTLQY